MLAYTRVVARKAVLPRLAPIRHMHAKPLRPWSSHRLTTAEPAPKTDMAGASSPSEARALREQAKKASASQETAAAAPKPRRRRPLKPLKAAISLTPTAVAHLRQLLDSPEPKLIRISVRNWGCSGLTYNLEYVEKPGKFDEEVVQDGVKVLIDSKALFSVIGSQMDWVDDKLSSRFVFSNPNSKGECGCGESFMV